jgi:hypothetical protein
MATTTDLDAVAPHCEPAFFRALRAVLPSGFSTALGLENSARLFALWTPVYATIAAFAARR